MLLASPLLLELPVTPCVHKFLSFHYPSGITLTKDDPRLAQLWIMLQSRKVSTKRLIYLPLHIDFTERLCFETTQLNGNRAVKPFNYHEINMLDEMFKIQILVDFMRFLQTDRGNCTDELCNCMTTFRELYGFSEQDLPSNRLEAVYKRYLADRPTSQIDQVIDRPLFIVSQGAGLPALQLA